MTEWREVVGGLMAARGQALKRYAYVLCGSDDEAEDLVQQALVNALSRGRGRDLRSPEAYVKRVITNEYLDRRRAQETWLRHARRVVPSAHDDDNVSQVALGDDVRTALFALSPRQRACVVLRFYEDLTVPEVARTLGLGEGTVKRYLSESLARLRPRLNENI
jgi:RNA polymerase sigma-70 factor (sigma-E family)